MARRQELEKPFLDVQGDSRCFSIPKRKWRELLFIGAMVRDGEAYVRDPSRSLPLFEIPNLFPAGVRFLVREEKRRAYIERID